ncbi:thymidylate synthase [Roseobacter phage RD-1410W1-01]|uniref:Thymidylate synthase n=1 Tax=Roseobacter phage RD-1410W1-01 TaxID=1815984 RepID=A0A191VYH8_9CAUD|nr:thymidylate synthase [Roseobacter phage RD-1410W1-01]ANJ20765.1 thymidylate synthase [Roseobacter phage RD-1410W1-01]
MTKPKLLILGYGRHGKDTVAEMLQNYGFNFMSSSEFVGREILWDAWGSAVYDTFEEMFADRSNHRVLWMQMISAYNTPDKTKTASTMLERGYDMYVGMRRFDELQACKEAGIFDKIIWVDRSEHLPPEEGSMDITKENCGADVIIYNNGSLAQLEQSVAVLVEEYLQDHCGFEWDLPMPETITMGGRTFTPQPYFPGERQTVAERPQSEPTKTDSDQVDLMELPEGAIPVLDHGYVKLVRVDGTEDDIARAARLSYGRGTQKRTDNAGLIRYLYMNAHTSPFEMCEIVVQMRLPIFVMRQLVRHRTANLNEYSGRYSIMPRLFYIPEMDRMNTQSKANKQGSDDNMIRDADYFRRAIEEQCHEAFDLYEALVADDVDFTRELARNHLPLNTYTEVVWKMDLNNLFKFLALRDDEHAQWEIRVYAQIIAEFVRENFPAAYAAYERKKSMVTMTWEQLVALTSGFGRDDLPKSERAQIDDIQRRLQQDITAKMAQMVDLGAQNGPVNLAP